MVSAMMAAVLGLGTAQAVEDPYLFERAQRRGKVGLYMGALGPPVALVGVAAMFGGYSVAAASDFDVGVGVGLGGFVLAGVGSAGVLVGPPLLAASSVRGATLSGADKTLGYATWGLWGAALLSGSVGEVFPGASTAVGIGGLLCYGGSLVTGGLQLRANEVAAGTSSVSLQLVPTANGLSLAGQF